MPRISAILCTRDGSAGFQRALASVLAQQHPVDEIVVVACDAAQLVLPDTGPACIVLNGACAGVAEARRAGLQAATGDLLAWCDDDAEWLPQHIGVLRDALAAHPGATLACAQSAQGPLLDDLPPAFRLRASGVLHVAAAARAVGGFDRAAGPFAAGDLWARMAERAEPVISPQDTTVHTAPQPADGAGEQAAALERLRACWADAQARAGESRRRLAERAEGTVPFNPSTWDARRRRLLFQTVTHLPASFAIVSRALIRELQGLGVQVTLGPLREGQPDSEWPAVTGSPEPQDCLGLIYDYRSGPAGLRAERVAYYYMWPTRLVPHWQVAEINAAASLFYTPSRANALIARENGVRTPIRVLPHGVDPIAFPYLERRRDPDAPYTFGSASVFHAGKGIDVLLRAFLAEFSPDEPVRLLLKHSYGRLDVEIPEDPRIELRRRFLGHENYLAFFAELDAYVLPTRGEGFALTGLEALSTGLPLIATNWSGPADYLDPSDSFPLRFSFVDAAGVRINRTRHFGLWAEPDITHLRELMRYVYTHRAEAADAGRRAAQRVQRDWTWRRPAQQLIDDFDALAAGVTPASDQ